MDHLGILGRIPRPKSSRLQSKQSFALESASSFYGNLPLIEFVDVLSMGLEVWMQNGTMAPSIPSLLLKNVLSLHQCSMMKQSEKVEPPWVVWGCQDPIVSFSEYTCDFKFNLFLLITVSNFQCVCKHHDSSCGHAACLQMITQTGWFPLPSTDQIATATRPKVLHQLTCQWLPSQGGTWKPWSIARANCFTMNLYRHVFLGN